MRPITINPALNGYVCQVGCQVVVFESRKALIENLDNYLQHPDSMERQFILNAVNPMKDPSVPGAPCPPPTDAPRALAQLAPDQGCDCEARPQTEARNPVLRRH